MQWSFPFERRAWGPIGALMGPEIGVFPVGRMSFPLDNGVHALEMCFRATTTKAAASERL